MNAWITELRQAFRVLVRNPGHSTMVVVILALGIGASAAVYALVSRTLVQPLPYAEPESLFLMRYRTPASPHPVTVPAPDVPIFRDRVPGIVDLAFISRAADVVLRLGDRAEHLSVGIVSDNLFSLLGVRAAVGRTFASGEGLIPPDTDADSVVAASPTTIVLSHRLWTRRFAGDPRVLGRVVRLDGQFATVIGIMPEGFEVRLPAEAGIPGRVDAWTPVRVPLSRLERPDALTDQDSDNTGVVIGRLKRGVAVDQAAAAMRRVAADLRSESAWHQRAAIDVAAGMLHQELSRRVRPILVALAGAVALVLLAACSNVAALLVVRLTTRRRELALREALGASRARLAGLLLAEALLLATAAGAGSVVVASWGYDALVALGPADLQLEGDIGGTLVSAVLAFSLIAGIGVGVVPALATAHAGGHGTPRSRISGGRSQSQVRAALVVCQASLAVVLLLGAGLMLKSLIRLSRVEPGFSVAGVLTLDLSLRAMEGLRSPAARAEFIRSAEERVTLLPGVRAVGAVSQLPLSGREWTNPYGTGEGGPTEWSARQADFRMITPGYFEAIGTRMLLGRSFTIEENRAEDRRVAIIDETLARRIAPDGDALGHRLRFPLDGDPISAEVVGIVEHVRHASLRADGRETIYVPYRHEASRDMSLVVRAAGDPRSLAPAVRRALSSQAGGLAIHNVRTLRDVVTLATTPDRFALLVLAAFGGLALFLAALGLYAVVAYSVEWRRRELALRLALGATRRESLYLVMRSAGMLVVMGLCGGLVAAAVATRALRSLLFDVASFDPATVGLTVIVFTVVALAAVYLPARRVLRINPMAVLRSE